MELCICRLGACQFIEPGVNISIFDEYLRSTQSIKQLYLLCIMAIGLAIMFIHILGAGKY